jgi:Ca2+/Na+ antiporter
MNTTILILLILAIIFSIIMYRKKRLVIFIFSVIRLYYLALFKRKYQKSVNEEKEKANIKVLDSKSKDIEKFNSIVKESNKELQIVLQNEICNFIISKKIMETFKDLETDYHIRKNCKNLTQTNGLDISSVTIVFNSDDINGEGPNIVSDKSGAIFWYHFGFGSPKVEYLDDSIWSFIGSEEELIRLLKKQDDIVTIKKLPKVGEFIHKNAIIKFDVHGFYINDYQSQLIKLFNQSEGKLKIDFYEIDKLRKEKKEFNIINLGINSKAFKLELEDSKWYNFNFPNMINGYLEELNSEFRLCLVHENGWDEIYGITLGNIEEYELLKRNKLIPRMQ